MQRSPRGSPNTTYWESLGTVPRSERGDSVIQGARHQDNRFTLNLQELAEWWYSLELSRLAVDECLASSDLLTTLFA
jgi:hypothetical protein